MKDLEAFENWDSQKNRALLLLSSLGAFALMIGIAGQFSSRVDSDWTSWSWLAPTILICGGILSFSCWHLLQSDRRRSIEIAGLRKIMDLNCDAWIRLDVAGRIAEWGPGAEKLYGWSHDEVVGRKLGEFFSLPSSGSDDENLAETLRARRQTRMQGQMLTKAGNRRDVDFRIAWISDRAIISVFETRQTEMNEDEKLAWISKLENRVSERTAELKAREDFLGIITDSIPVGIAYLDSAMQFQFANKFYRQFHSLEDREWREKSFSEVFGAESYRLIEGYLHRVLEGETVRFEGWHPFRETQYVNVLLLPDRDSLGTVRGCVALLTDVSEYKRIEQELRLAKEAAETANTAKSRFIANMSHELRTPLGAMLGFTQLLAGTQLNRSEREELVARVKRNGELLEHIIEDVLDLARIESGQLRVENRLVEIDELIQDLHSLFLPRLAKKNLELKLTRSSDLPKTISTDPFRLQQILLNVVGNAIKFTHEGSVRMNFHFRKGESQRSSSGPGTLEIDVSDTGEGIKFEAIDSLFSMFMQADSSSTRRFGGSGSGLSLSRKLARLLGGDLQLVRTELGRGSVFRLSVKDNPQELQQFQPRVGKDSKNGSSLRAHVLVVEDSEDNQFLMTHLLSKAGLTFQTAANGAEALELMKDRKFDLILMDLQMPVMDGLEATRQIRNSGNTIPIIAVTAHAMKENRIEARKIGVDDYLTKPIDFDTLMKSVTERLRYEDMSKKTNGIRN